MTRTAGAAALLLAAVGSACASTQARGAAVGPALDTPAPPPHVIRTPEEPGEAASSGGAEPGRGAATPRPAPVKPDDAGAAESPRSVSPTPEAKPLPPLQTSANVPEVEKKVRLLLQQAVRDLDRTDYQALNADSRAEYDTAKRFIRQATDALTEKDVTFAEQLARKAATLAARLAARRPSAAPLIAGTRPA